MITPYAGKNFRCEVETASGTWEPVPCERTSSGAITNEVVDVTTKTDMDTSAFKRGAAYGIRSGEIKASGVVSDINTKALFNFLMARAMDGAIFNIRSKSDNAPWFTAPCQLASMERSGDYNNAELYSLSFASASDPFEDYLIFDVKTDNSGDSSSTQFALPLVNGGAYNMTVFWGDGTSSAITAWDSPEVTHTYSIAGTYEIKIKGHCSGWSFDAAAVDDAPKVLDLKHWGDLDMGDWEGAWEGCVNLVVSATDIPDLSHMTSMGSMFFGCTSLTTIPNSAFWDTSTITMLRHLFSQATNANIDVSGWDVSNVTNMFRVFRQCAFNGDLSLWDVRKVTSLGGMFSGNTAFNQDLSSWQTDALTSMEQTFFNCPTFKKADKLANWNMTKVTSLSACFSSVDLNDPNSTANQNNYNAVLIGWAAQNVLTGVPFGAGAATKYTIATAGAARTTLLGKGWTISDGGGV